MTTTAAAVHASIDAIADEWREQRGVRQLRRSLDPVDFDRLRDAGLLTLPVPVEDGGLWESMASSARPMCETYRALAGGDPSVALVSSMHPAVIAFWLANPDASQPDWEAQRQAVFASAMAGEQWGTITSEPGSGGDLAKTRAIATPLDGALFMPGRVYAVSGDKHFGSGSGITDRMMTTAVPSDGDAPTIFAFDASDRLWDGSAGIELIAEWDGMGMAATQSHAMRLKELPCVRLARVGELQEVTFTAGPLVATLFTAVILGVLDEAVALARTQVTARAEGLRAYERVEWARAEQDHWVAQQAYEGALRAIEAGDPVVAFHDALRAKQATADIAEATLVRISRVLGGGTFSGRSPFAHWLEDVRALGFLRPPWGLAYDTLFMTSLAPS